MRHREFFKESYNLIKPYWVSEEKKKAFLFLVICLLLNFGFVYMSVQINYWSRDIYNALQSKNQLLFMDQVFKFFPILLFFLAFFVSKSFLESYLAFLWRKWSTKNTLQKWTKNNIYYHVMNSKSHIDNPDQRISQDLNSMPTYTLNLFITVIKEVVNVITFGVILWNLSKMINFTFSGLDLNIPGYLIWAALLYAAVGSGLMILIGRPLVKLDFLQEKYEANFRYSLIRLQERREEISLYDGVFTENKNLSSKFNDIKNNFYQIIKRKIYINICHNFYINLANLFPILVASPMYFAGVITLGNVMQISGAFSEVKSSFSIIVDNFTVLASLRATIIRLAELEYNIHDAEKLIENNKIKISTKKSDKLSIKNLHLKKPDDTSLKDKISIDLSLSDKLMIKGRSGVGKSTLIRSLKGLWKYGEGEIQIPDNKKTMFIPQRPYMPIDTLENVIFYPQHNPSNSVKKDIEKYLKKFNLEHLIPHLRKNKDWINVLSLGEQQRIAIVRALINDADIMILDEPTTSLDSDSESLAFKELFAKFKEKMIICVSHSDKFDHLFNKKLEL